MKPASSATSGSVARIARQSSNRASSSSTRRSRSGSRAASVCVDLAVAPAAPGPRERGDDDRCRRRARRAAAARRAGRSPRFGGSASTPGPNWSTSSALICAPLFPAAMLARMNAFIRVAIGELDWSRVVLHVGQTISASRSACRGGPASAAAAQTSARAASERRREPGHCALPSAA